MKSLSFVVSDLKFEIDIFSKQNEYRAQVRYVGAGQNQLLALHTPPRTQIHPTQFYRLRRYYRNCLVGAVKAELRDFRFRDYKPGMKILSATIGANLAGYPNGYPEILSDNMSDL